MTWEDFLPYILPSTPSCPQETAVHHVRLAANEFCRRAHVWRETLDTLIADGFRDTYSLAIDDQVEVAKVLAVRSRSNGDTPWVDHTIVMPLDGMAARAAGSIDAQAWVEDQRSICLLPVPPDGGEISVTVALKPSLTSFSFSDLVFAQHGADIADGALGRLLAMPKTDWTDFGAATAYTQKFNARAATAARAAERGYAKHRRDPSTRFY